MRSISSLARSPGMVRSVAGPSESFAIKRIFPTQVHGRVGEASLPREAVVFSLSWRVYFRAELCSARASTRSAMVAGDWSISP